MIVPDTNLLVHAYNTDAPQHSAARQWWDGLVNGVEKVGVPWIVATGFIRILSNRRIVPSPLIPAESVNLVEDWFNHGHIAPIDPGPAHIDLFRRFLDVPGSGPNLVPDAHIAAIAMEYDAEVHSADRDFGRFPGVRWRNPLAQETTG